MRAKTVQRVRGGRLLKGVNDEPFFLRHGFFRRKKLVFAEKIFGAQTRREEKQLDTQCTPLCLVFPPGALPGGHTHRSCGIPCGA